MQKNVIIVGSPRSGTSMTTRIFAQNNYFVAEEASTQLRQGDEYNPSGYWEAEPLIQANVDVFSAAGFDYDNTWLYDAISKQQAEKIYQISPLEQHRSLVNTYYQNSPWVWKDPRLCYTLPYWWQLMDPDNTGVLLLKREPEEIYQSFLRLKWRSGSTAEKETTLKLIQDHLDAAEAAVKKLNIPHIVVNYADFGKAPHQTVAAINKFFNLALTAADLGYDNKLNHTGLKGKLTYFLDRFAEKIPAGLRRFLKNLIPKKLLNNLFPHRYE